MCDNVNLEKIIAIHEQRLQQLEEQKALLGINTSPEISIEIEQIKEKIRNLKAQLDKDGSVTRDKSEKHFRKDYNEIDKKNQKLETELNAIAGKQQAKKKKQSGIRISIVVLVFSTLAFFAGGYFLDSESREIFLSEYVETFTFDEQGLEGWKPFIWNTGWINFVDSGSLEVVDKNFTLDGHSGPFLKYPLDLATEDEYASTKRSAVYQPVDSKVIGIVANVFYKSEPQYSREEVRAGFIISYDVNGDRLRTEDFLKKLTPNKWNTIVWSLYGPVWWAEEDKEKKWEEFKELFGTENYNLQVGRHLHDTKIEKIGIQFLVNSEGGSEEFKGTAYIDNIVLIYEHP
ncbi:MAG: hypothetical protein KDJ52_12265 [Anaerolineae bacterium]|nr:hypothetical protein [Anaerolineae bacterium]